MIELTAKAKKWGNSVGVLLPKSAGIRPNEQIRLHIERTKGFSKVGDIFGTIKLKRATEQLSRETDQELDVDL